MTDGTSEINTTVQSTVYLDCTSCGRKSVSESDSSYDAYIDF